MFKIWSEKNKAAKEVLTPNLDLRDWSELKAEEKDKIWQYIKYWFMGDSRGKNLRVFLAIHKLNNLHKYQSYAKRFLRSLSPEDAIIDFEDIFLNQEKNVVLELFSCFCETLIAEKKEKNYSIRKADYESEEKYREALAEWEHGELDNFSKKLNDIFEHFKINLFLTREGFVEKQDPKITNEIYVPVLNFLSSSTWNKVSGELRDAFEEYQKKTKQGYSNCITHAVSSLQAYLQTLVDGKTGSSEGIKSLIKKAQENNLIPDDKFTSEIFKNIESILMRERGKTGDAHPKQEYANERNARLLLNLVMIFLQHCIQYK